MVAVELYCHLLDLRVCDSYALWQTYPVSLIMLTNNVAIALPV